MKIPIDCCNLTNVIENAMRKNLNICKTGYNFTCTPALYERDRYLRNKGKKTQQSSRTPFKRINDYFFLLTRLYMI